MVIQRWQSVLLLIASVCMAFFCFIPFASITQDSQLVAVTPQEFIVYFVLNITVAILLFLAIFMYKDMKRQRTVTLLSMMLIVVSAVTGLFIVYGGEGEARIELWGGVILLVLALVAALWAYRRIGADQRLLRAADRLR